MDRVPGPHPAQAAQPGLGRHGLCAGCRHFPALLDAGRCEPGDACVRAHSGRQIDRFLRNNRQEAAYYLADLFWERRAIAARYAPDDLLEPLVQDTDEVVRRVVATRLPVAALGRLLRDPDREVRITVAQRLPERELVRLAGDADYRVRMVVADRLPHGKLLAMTGDAEREVRKIVARRLPAFALDALAGDPEPEVRRIVAERALPVVASARTCFSLTFGAIAGTASIIICT